MSYYSRNKEKILAKLKFRYEADPEYRRKILDRNLANQKKNPEAHLRACRRYHASWSAEQKILHSFRSRLYFTLKGKVKAARTKELIGISMEGLKDHLEKQFRPGMTWENYGKIWHVDHRRPCASFDFSDLSQQRECFHFTNLQPLFATENLKKRDTFSCREEK